MEYEDLKNKNNNSISAAYDPEFQNYGISQQPPEFNAPSLTPETGTPVEVDPGNRDYEADYNRLKRDDINPIHESTLMRYSQLNPGKLTRYSYDGYYVIKSQASNQPWFIRKISYGTEPFEPYTQGYSDEVSQSMREKPQQRKYVEFSGVTLKIYPDNGPISIDNGGTVGLDSGDYSFSFNITNGDFTIRNKLIPLGEVSGNIFKYPKFGLNAKLKPQLGPFSFDLGTNEFEVELKIPGLPHSPSICISAIINQKAVQQDFEQIVQYDWFPFIGKIIDALNQN